MVVGRWMALICRVNAFSASLNDAPLARLNEIVLVTYWPVWFTASGVMPISKCEKAPSGIILDFSVLTACAVEAEPRPIAAMELSAALRTGSVAMDEAL